MILNDLHLGVQRTGGTTPQSAQALRDFLREGLSRMLADYKGHDVVVNGDLLDKFEIDTSEVIKVYEIFADWLNETYLPTLTLIMGNHDSNPRGNKLSSFHLLAHFLQARFPDSVKVMDKGFDHLSENVWAIPHMPNQECFQIEVDRACAEDGRGKYLLLHANVKNTFAEHSDHSLNLTNDMLAGLMQAGWNLCIGHEHCGYELRSGRVVVVGNQWPSSVSDCIGETEKHAVEITPGGLKYVKTWSAPESYAEIDWRELNGTDAQFIRVVGDATAAEAADVISAISKFRQKSQAYVISNGVRTDGVAALEEMSLDAVSDIRALDVKAALYENLDDRDQKTTEELLNA